jgi:hypothetical protein
MTAFGFRAPCGARRGPRPQLCLSQRSRPGSPPIWADAAPSGLVFGKAAELVETAVPETLTYYAFPEEHWRRIRTTDEMDTDEMDKPFWVRGGIFSCAGDLVAKRGVTVGSAARCLIRALPD